MAEAWREASDGGASSAECRRAGAFADAAAAAAPALSVVLPARFAMQAGCVPWCAVQRTGKLDEEESIGSDVHQDGAVTVRKPLLCMRPKWLCLLTSAEPSAKTIDGIITLLYNIKDSEI